MKGITQRMAALVVTYSVMAALTIAHAQDKDQFRNQAKTIAAQMRAAGEPKDRCSIGAQIGSNGLVVRIYGASSLFLGDKFLSINHVDSSGKSADAIIEILRSISPSVVIPVTVEREGKPVDAQISCANARPYNEKILAALDFAANGKFDDCVNVLSQEGQFGSYDAVLKVECAITSKNAR
ncbi:MAG TPA: hypothetical protein VFI32_00730, partial [Rhodanobacteraceae bacterium]|nr:hypothetical protein [Rhodanobacteraceae bacterium]